MLLLGQIELLGDDPRFDRLIVRRSDVTKDAFLEFFFLHACTLVPPRSRVYGRRVVRATQIQPEVYAVEAAAGAGLL